MEFLEVLTEGLNRVLLVRGGGREVITIYSWNETYMDSALSFLCINPGKSCPTLILLRYSYYYV